MWPLTTAQLIDLGAAALWDPQDAYLPTLDIMGIKCIWSLLTLRLAVIILLGAVGSLQCFPDQLAKFKGSWEGNGWSNTGRCGKDGGGKRKGSASTPHEVPSNFSAVVVPTLISSVLLMTATL